MAEAWLIIEGYENLYEVSNYGNVRCCLSHKIKSQSGGNTAKNRYKYVTLYKNNVGTKIMVHRLVAKAFIPNPNNFPYVLHIKNNRSNNSARNLYWGNQKHNRRDSKQEGTAYVFVPRRGKDNNNTKLDVEKVKQIRNMYPQTSQEKLATIFNVSRGSIRGILSNKSWKWV